MNRRNFLLSSVITTGALALFPAATLANTNIKMLPCLSNQLNLTGTYTLSNLPFEFSNACENLMTTLKEEGYLFNVNNVVKLNDTCFAISIQKNSLLGFKSNELALLVNEGNTSKHYILEEEMANEFNALIENYSFNMNAGGFNYDVAEFAFPVKVKEVKKGKERVFSYTNKLDNTIAFISNKKMTKTIIC